MSPDTIGIISINYAHSFTMNRPKDVLGKRVSVATIAAMMVWGGLALYPVTATANSVLISQAQQDGWNTVLQTARLVNANQQVTDLVLQLQVLNKPATSYANAVYQVFARKGDRWVQVYTTTGARLISGSSNQVVLPPEVIPLETIRKALGSDVDLNELELQTITFLRYDLQGGQRDQTVKLEQTTRYASIAQSVTTQLISVSSGSSSSGSSSSVATGSCSSGYVSTGQTTQRGFTLALNQQQASLANVIARVSLMPKRIDGYGPEQFLGDYRYKLNQKAKFVQGLQEGDRVIVRLFSPNQNFLGYSAFEVLPAHSVVNLVLGDRPTESRLLRTIYGLDTNEDGAIDSGKTIYNYFTQVSGANWQTSQVSFLNQVSGANLNSFQIGSLPAINPAGTYSCSFLNGNLALVNRTIRTFTTNLAPALVTVPGQVTQVVNLSSTQVSTFETTRQINTYRKVGVSQGSTVTKIVEAEGSNNQSSGKKPKQRCNQGIGNGAEGCDPGNSRPHGGSNDEGGRTPGGGGRGKK